VRETHAVRTARRKKARPVSPGDKTFETRNHRPRNDRPFGNFASKCCSRISIGRACVSPFGHDRFPGRSHSATFHPISSRSVDHLDTVPCSWTRFPVPHWVSESTSQRQSHNVHVAAKVGTSTWRGGGATSRTGEQWGAIGF